MRYVYVPRTHETFTKEEYDRRSAGQPDAQPKAETNPFAGGGGIDIEPNRQASQLELRVDDIDRLVKHLAEVNGRIAKVLDRAGGPLPEAKNGEAQPVFEPGLLGGLRVGLAKLERLVAETDELADRAETLIG